MGFDGFRSTGEPADHLPPESQKRRVLAERQRGLLPVARGVGGEHRGSAAVERLHGEHGHVTSRRGKRGQHRGAGPRGGHSRAAVQWRKAGRLRSALARGKEAGDVGKNRMPHAVGRQNRQERLSKLPELASAEFRGQGVAERRARVSAGPEAVIAAEHEQARSRTNPLQKHLLLLGPDIGAVDVAEDEHVELVDRRLVGGNRRESQVAHVRASQKHVRPGLHQRTELHIGILGEKAIDQGAVFGS